MRAAISSAALRTVVSAAMTALSISFRLKDGGCGGSGICPNFGLVLPAKALVVSSSVSAFADVARRGGPRCGRFDVDLRWRRLSFPASEEASSATATETTTRMRHSRVDSDESFVENAVRLQQKDAPDETTDAAASETASIDADREAFLARTKVLCAERNLPLRSVKNARDLASVSRSPVSPGRVYRAGRLSDASAEDVSLLFESLGIRTLVDLRSPTELRDDPTLDRHDVFGDFVSVVWSERGDTVRELDKGVPRIESRVNEDGSHKKKRRKREQVRNILGGARKHRRSGEGAEELDGGSGAANEATETMQCDDGDDANAGVGEVKTIKEMVVVHEGSSGAAVAAATATITTTNAKGVTGEEGKFVAGRGRKERHFVSLMNEFKYVRGTLGKLRKRDVARAILHAPTSIVSKRARHRVKDVFLSEINDGGLPLLNELVLKYGAPGIRRVLDICSDRTRHPVVFYCTAGKDRTGVIAAVLLSTLGVPDEEIVEDYSLSANVYAEMNDHTAMVGALSQRNLDPETFLGAPPEVMRDTLAALREVYGGVEGYLDWIGFDKEKREKLREALLES